MKNGILFYTLLILFVSACGQPRSREAVALRINGSNGVRPLLEQLAEAYQKENPHVTISIAADMNPEQRIEALKSDSIDLAMASHGVDVHYLELQQLQAHRFAQMPVVMAVPAALPVDSIDGSQVCGVYSGKLSNWQQLGGPDMTVRPLIRPFEEVDSEVLRENIPCMKIIRLDTAVQQIERSGALARALAETPGAIGVTTLVRVTQSEGKLKALHFNGVAPEPAMIKAGRYPLLREAFLISRAPTEAIEDFLAFVYSKNGAKIMAANSAAATARTAPHQHTH